jgi:Na+-translocating ferredoxin:NAD+ oxidoreductase RnfD subunit
VTSGTAVSGTSKGLQFGDRRFTVVAPRISDARLHLAAVIVSLQVLGQAGLGFRVSIAQILVSLATCAVLEVAIALVRDRALAWPASALLTGNGVAFILRVPGTHHGDWWSLRGWWIYCATAAIALLSKYVIRWRGRHIFNPSNFGLVICLWVLGSTRVEPLDFWWGPLTPPLILALALIGAGGFTILSRLRLLGIAAAFWVSFTLALLPIAATGHGFSARWHVGPVSGFEFWWVLISSPEILVFLFFMSTDPKTIPATGRGRIVYAVSIGLLAAFFVAPAQTEFGAKLGVLTALFIVCGTRPFIEQYAPRVRLRLSRSQILVSGAAAITALAACLALMSASPPGNGNAMGLAAWPSSVARQVPPFTILPDRQVPATIAPSQARQMAGDLVIDLRMLTEGLQRRDRALLAVGATAIWLLKLQQKLAAAGTGGVMHVPVYHVSRLTFRLEPRPLQAWPAIMVTLYGTVVDATFSGVPPREVARSAPRPLSKSFEIAKESGHYRIVSDKLPPGGSRGS